MVTYKKDVNKSRKVETLFCFFSVNEINTSIHQRLLAARVLHEPLPIGAAQRLKLKELLAGYRKNTRTNEPLSGQQNAAVGIAALIAEVATIEGP